MQPGTRDCLVLVVEDDDDTRDSLEELLGHEGYGVLAAANGAAALTLLRATPRARKPPCDLVILDLMMPVMNGWDFRARQRADPALAGIPVLLMSAGGHLASVSGELQADDYISKPVEVPDFLDKIARLHTRSEMS
jgi:CheY-like chemotaxis protein